MFTSPTSCSTSLTIISLSVGDVNKDGNADILIGAKDASGYGHVYVLYGPSSNWGLSSGYMSGGCGYSTQGLDTGGPLINGTKGVRF